MQKRGDFSLSFGMIFSVIIIVTIIAIAVYVIVNFVRLGKCGEIGLFYNDLEKEVNKAWRATIYQDIFRGELPPGIEFVCFGDLENSARPSGKESEIYDFLFRYRKQEANIFLYPAQMACDNKLAFSKLENAKIEGFFCIPVETGNVKIKIEKDRFDELVRVSK